ncbi:hypothetical protein FA13DRAFT_1729345 [Coprinellus micaceus]|uniref:Uncharacterized protein n=1 Tax=Coprinellus micaceus TaxID=71717 RepID=A0A4Y7TMD9_COPMI|nr:hypothetical protein FA13DRAFT_1729345 [Coprinellus micaceus]
MRAGDLDLGAHLPISLAKVVLDFMKSHSSEAEEIYFNVVKICYEFAQAGVMGVIFIDRGLEEAYEYASHLLAPWKSEMPGWGRDIHGPRRTHKAPVLETTSRWKAGVRGYHKSIRTKR